MVGYAQDDRRRAKDDRHIASMGEPGSQSLGKLITDADGCSGSLERRAGRSFDSTAVGYWIRHGWQELKIDFQRGQNCRGPFWAPGFRSCCTRRWPADPPREWRAVPGCHRRPAAPGCASVR